MAFNSHGVVQIALTIDLSVPVVYADTMFAYPTT